MAAVVFEDLSGTATTPNSQSANPYQPLIENANNDPLQIQSRYSTHRTTRNEVQRSIILDPSFSAWTLDPILAKLDGPNKDPGFVDDRFCLVFWGRPPRHIRDMIDNIQQELRSVVPDMWFMPLENLHITVLELIFSVSESEVERIVETLLQNGTAEKIANTTFDLPQCQRPRLVRPMISFDAAAMALSFVPAAGENQQQNAEEELEEGSSRGKFTYHHLRKDIYDKVVAAGIKPASRYAVPSAHLTIARFINQNGFLCDDGVTFDHAKVKRVIDKIEELNDRLQAQYWPKTDAAGGIPHGGDWTIGQEKGLDFHTNQLV
ncbi:hypothetical protein UA08_04442 [Talaromyces atroroseus]|uniref:Uncharacterized protein n=1 Tax=Talaromyces atroroseus TaxID=1441469 RepID=A0A1Q5Q9G3_TALAT|nr:hypothetical protein UA08_04442 [Talaromyces atroroseus]OKL60776.1 hypothetical protein UA08_04442 [Talaromyces atroroseus]